MSEQVSLDVLLDGWARSVRLDAAEADRMRRSIVEQATSSALPLDWWRTFAFQVSDVVVRAHRQPALALPGWSA